MRALIFGAGAVGTRVAQQLLASNSVDEILLRDISPEKLGLASKTLGSRVLVEHFPFSGSMDADIVVVASPRGTQLEIVKNAIRLKRPTILVSDGLTETVSILKLQEQAMDSRVPLIIGAGFAPGLSCVLAAYGNASMEKTEEIHISKCGTGGPACALVHHRALIRNSYDWKNDWVKRRGGSGRELLWFPEPIGPQDCYRAALSDPVLIHHAFPDVSRITSRVAATRRDRLTASLPMLAPPHDEGAAGAIRVEVRGIKNGIQEVLVQGVVEKPAVGAASVAALTAEWFLKNKIKTQQMVTLGEVVEPKFFLSELFKRGINVKIFDGKNGTF